MKDCKDCIHCHMYSETTAFCILNEWWEFRNEAEICPAYRKDKENTNE